MSETMTGKPDSKALRHLADLADQRLPFTNEDLAVLEAAIAFIEAVPPYGVSCWMAGQSCEPCEGFLELEDAFGNDVQWIRDNSDQW